MADGISHQLADLRGEMGTAVGGNEANVMNHFLFDGDVAGALHDLDVGVVARRQHGRSFIRPENAALCERAAFGTVPLVLAIVGSA